MLRLVVDDDNNQREVDPRYRGPAIPSKAFKLLQNMTEGSSNPNQYAKQTGTNRFYIYWNFFEAPCFSMQPESELMRVVFYLQCSPNSEITLTLFSLITNNWVGS